MLLNRRRHGGMACINSKISEGVLYKDMVCNKILKKETFEIFLQYCITRQKWAGVRGPLARGPYHKEPLAKGLPKSKDLWSKGPSFLKYLLSMYYCTKYSPNLINDLMEKF